MEARTKHDSFGTFLKTIESHGIGEANDQQEHEAFPVDSLRILVSLAKSGSEPVTQLLADSEVEFVKFADALKEMRGASLIDLTGEPGNETVQITPTGEQLAEQLARLTAR